MSRADAEGRTFLVFLLAIITAVLLMMYWQEPTHPAFFLILAGLVGVIPFGVLIRLLWFK